MKSEVVVAILGAGGFSAILAAIVTGLFSKRKIGAEATDIITKAAAGVVTNMQNEIDRQAKLRETMIIEHKADVKAICDRHEEEMTEVRRVLQLHVAWDAIAIAEMSKAGIDLPAAPPLLPPSQRLDHDLH